MRRAVDVLYIDQQQVGIAQQLPKPRKKRLLARKRLTGGVHAGVDAPALCLTKQLGQKLDLQQRFAAAHGNAALRSPIGAVALGAVEQLAGGHLGADAHAPGVGVVTVAAPHGAALQKYQKPDARTVHRAEALCGMNIALQHETSPAFLSIAFLIYKKISVQSYYTQKNPVGKARRKGILKFGETDIFRPENHYFLV